MRAVEIGGEAVELRGSALAPLTWYDEFHDDGLYDALVRVSSPRRGVAPNLPMRDVLRCAWVMAHDADVAAGRDPVGFRQWVAAHPEVDFVALSEAVNKEAVASFFPSLAQRAQKARERAKGLGAAAPGGDADEREADGPRPRRTRKA